MSLQGFGRIAEELRRSTVQVTSEGGRAAQGSGFIARSDGVIITNAHVVLEGARGRSALYVTLWDGSRFPARIGAHSKQRDLAALRIPAARLAAVRLADSTNCGWASW